MSEAAPQLHTSDRLTATQDRSIDLVGVLEERLASLVERHREALKTIEELRTQLHDRRAQMGELSRRLEDREANREEAQRRVEGVIERLARVEAALSARPSGGGRDSG